MLSLPVVVLTEELGTKFRRVVLLYCTVYYRPTVHLHIHLYLFSSQKPLAESQRHGCKNLTPFTLNEIFVSWSV